MNLHFSPHILKTLFEVKDILVCVKSVLHINTMHTKWMLKNNTNLPYQREYHISSIQTEISVSSCGEEMHHTLENCLGKNLNGNNEYK